MGTILKVTTQWSGFVGSPGYSNFYFHETNPGASFDAGATAAVDKLVTFWGALKGYIPAGTKLDILSDVTLIEETTGEMTGIASAGAARPTITSTATSGIYSAATGAVITWRTGGVRHGRRVRGRTFIVPGAFAMLQTDGQLNPTAKAAIQAAATALIAPNPDRALVVWARPTSKGATDGIQHTVLSATVPQKVAVLKSRRD